MALSNLTYNCYKDLMDDELIRKAVERLKKRRATIVEWQKESDPLEECPNCEGENIKYKWDRRICKDCGYEEDYSAPTKQKGVPNSLKLESIIKEVFGIKLANKRKEEKVKPKEISKLPISLTEFDTGEYTNEEVKFLVERYKSYIDNIGELEPNDEFMIHSLVLQELNIKKLYRLEAVDSESVKSSDKKKEMKVYRDMAQELESTKASRKGDEKRDVISGIVDEFEDESIEEYLEEFKNERKERKEKLEEIEENKEVDNPYYGQRS